MEPKKMAGEKVRYRSFSGDTYDAVVVRCTDGADSFGDFLGFVDIEVILPGCAKRFPLRGIRLVEEPAGSTCAWRPK